MNTQTDETASTQKDELEETLELIREIASWDEERFPAAKDARRILRNAGEEVPR